MHKNLKKVISSIAALALSASSFVALAATTSYPDVAETANYYKAVTELSALNVINGYEDGTFGPEKLVTRAEITKMIVAALGPAYTNAANAAAGQNTKFTDVTASHWAAGFVTEGTTVGFIAGMGDGTFAPNSNVTFAQATTMLVRSAGYETWAKAQGYPQGYMSYGSQLEITKGVNVDNNTELNRGQVAILIDNTLDAPILKVTGYTAVANGDSVPEYTKMDGSNSENPDKQTILTENHNASRVYGRVSATAKTNNGLNSDEVRFDVEKSYNWVENPLKQKEVRATATTNATAPQGNQKVYLNGTDADQYLDIYAEAIIRKTADDDLEFVSFFPSAKVETVALKTTDYAATKTGNDLFGEGLKYYTYTDDNHSSTKYYTIDPAANVYVNGIQIATANRQAAINTYVNNNIIGDITLMDVPQTGQTSTDGKYDTILVTYYVDGIVDSVVESASTPKVYFSNVEGSAFSELKMEPDNSNKSYKFTLDGAEIKYTDLEKDDIVSIAYDVVTGFANSNTYDIIVSRNSVSGTVDSLKANKTVPTLTDYTVAGSAYTNVDGLVANNALVADGTEYVLYLDAFDRIAKVEEGTAASRKLCIVDALDTSGDTRYATIITADGSKVKYEIKSTSPVSYDTLNANNAVESGQVYTYTGTSRTGKTSPESRVYRYSVNSKNELSLTGPIAGSASAAAGTVNDYSIDTMKVGSIRLSDSTAVLDATDYDGSLTYDIVAGSLIDGNDYRVVGFDRNTDDGTYRFAVITNGAEKITTTSNMAVVSSIGSSNVDGETLTTVEAYTANEGADADGFITLYIDNGVNFGATNAAAVLTEGTPFYYTTNSDGYVDRLDVLGVTPAGGHMIDFADATSVQNYVFRAPLTGYAEDNATINAINDVFTTDSDGDGNVEVLATTFTDNVAGPAATAAYMGTGRDSSDNAQFKIAPVMKKSNNSLFFAEGSSADAPMKAYNANITYAQIGTVAAGAVQPAGIAAGTTKTVFASDVNDGDSNTVLSGSPVLVCDLAANRNKVSKGTFASILASRFTNPAKVAGLQTYNYGFIAAVVDPTTGAITTPASTTKTTASAYTNAMAALKDYVVWDNVIDNNGTNDNADVTYALVKTIDDDITEVYVILPDND